MDSRASGKLTGLLVGNIESLLVYTFPDQPEIFLLYIDGIFVIWGHGKSEVLTLFDRINSCDDCIKLCLIVSPIKICILDVTIETF